MHLLYYDEVKFDPKTQASYWLGGVSVDSAVVPDLEALVSQISADVFGTPLLSKGTEFHGIEICRGKGNFKGRDFEERLEVLKRLLDIIARDDVKRICVKINPKFLVHTSDKPAEIAFMYFVEQADQLFAEQDTLGMLFGDYDEPIIGSSVASLSEFRQGGTRWRRSRDIKNIIDTVHFAQSHHSRLIQLADVFLYCKQFISQPNDAPWRSAIREVIVESRCYKCDKMREWPLEPIWYR